MIIYLLKSVLCLLVLFIFYKSALENEKMHRFKRFYLLGALLLSLLIPLITFSYETEAIEIPAQSQEAIEFRQDADNGNFQPPVGTVTNFFPYILWSIYVSGFAVFGFRFIRNLLQIKTKIRDNKKIFSREYTNVLIPKKTAPHSFLKYIFLNEKDFEEELIAPEILAHEKAHVVQKHSWDILFVETLQVIFWFNPLLFFLKNSIQINHEFLADESVISANDQILDYSQLLLHYSAGTHHSGMSSAFNHLLIKKRISMITKPFSRKKLVVRLSLLLPVIAVCLLLFNNKIVAKPASVEIINTSVSQDLFVPKKTSSSEGRKFPNSELHQEKDIQIRLENNKIFLNDEEVSLEDFSNTLDKLTADWTEEEIKKTSSMIQITNSRDILKKLNKEYQKTRFAKIKGIRILPLAPIEDIPAPPPAMEDASVPVPPAPAPSNAKNIQSSSPIQNSDKIITITVEGETISFGGIETNLENFVKDLNNFTENWDEKTRIETSFGLMYYNSDVISITKLKSEMKKTKYFQKTGNSFLPPPPAPPTHPGTKLPEPPAPPVRDELNEKRWKSEEMRELIDSISKEMRETMREEFIKEKFLNDSGRTQEIRQRGIALIQQKEEEMQYRQEESKQRREGFQDKSEQVISQYLQEREKLEKMLPEGYPAAFLNLSPKDQEDIQAQLTLTFEFYFELTEEEKTKVPYMFAPPPSTKLYEEKDGEIVKKANS